MESDNRRLMKKSTNIILIGVLIMAGLSYYVISQSPSLQESLEFDRPVARDTLVSLAIFLKDDNDKKALPGLIGGEQLVFSLSSNVPLHVALLASQNSKNPKIIYSGARIPPGEGKRLEKAGNRFVYKTVPKEGGVRFCLVQASNDTDLTTKLLRPKNTWLRIPEAQCVEVMID